MKSTLPDFALADAFQEILGARHSCRGYLAEPVAQDMIGSILRMAQRTPSWCNAQPWGVIVTGAAATERLRQALQSPQAMAETASDIAPPLEYRGVYQERRRECGLQLYDSVGIAHGDRQASMRQALENFKFFGAPHVAIITTETLLGTYGAVDCGAYINNFMLAARSLGVASIAQAAIAMRSRFLHEFFKIPAERQIVCGISFGYKDPDHPANGFRTTRASMERVVQWIDA
ncbi:MAG: nitroreductase [Burkholderiales bacterium]